MIALPEAFARSTVECEGDAGAVALQGTRDCPGLVGALARHCTLDGEVMRGGVGVIVPVRRSEQTAVLEASYPPGQRS
jgi:streptomycin 6-kinase